MNQRLVLFTKHLLDGMFGLGVLLTASIPIFFSWVGKYFINFRIYYIPLTILYVLSGILCLMILWQLRHMFDTVLADDAFVDANTISLQKMARYSLYISLLSALRLPFSPTPATVFIMIVFFIAALFSMVLSQVFAKAVQYKKENDLTI